MASGNHPFLAVWSKVHLNKLFISIPVHIIVWKDCWIIAITSPNESSIPSIDRKYMSVNVCDTSLLIFNLEATFSSFQQKTFLRVPSFRNICVSNFPWWTIPNSYSSLLSSSSISSTCKSGWWCGSYYTIWLNGGLWY